MAWITITDRDVLEEMTPAEVQALNTVQGGKRELERVLVRLVNSVRGKIVAADAPLGPEGTVPQQLEMEIIDVARWRWLMSFPQMAKFQSRERKDAYDKAMEELSRVQRGDVKIEDPGSAPGDPQAWTVLPKVGHKPKVLGPGREDGV